MLTRTPPESVVAANVGVTAEKVNASYWFALANAFVVGMNSMQDVMANNIDIDTVIVFFINIFAIRFLP